MIHLFFINWPTDFYFCSRIFCNIDIVNKVNQNSLTHTLILIFYNGYILSGLGMVLPKALHPCESLIDIRQNKIYVAFNIFSLINVVLTFFPAIKH